MSTEAIVIGVLVIVALGLGIGYWMYSSQNRSKHLKDTFGTEYERAVRDSGGVRQAQKELEGREKRVSRLAIKELTPEEQRIYADQWRSTQAHFVDDPSSAVKDADQLVGKVMEARGYPVGDFDQRAADVSVEHSNVVDNYRSAHDIAERHKKDGVSTEELRLAMVHYRSLFDDLLGATTPRTM
jgi:hypothetical protein